MLLKQTTLIKKKYPGHQNSHARGCVRVGERSRDVNLLMENISFQIDSSFQNGEKYVSGEVDVSPSILIDGRRATMG